MATLYRLYRFTGRPQRANNKDSQAAGFSDVPGTHWAYNAIDWMAGNGIVEGTGGNMFQPARGVARYEYAKMMVLWTI